MAVKTLWKKTALLVVLSIVLVSVMLTSPCAYAQVAGATLTGTVSDSSGAVIPNAQISIKNVATGQERVFSTDSAGFYSSPNLLPGQYAVTVTAAGFSTEVRSGITLTVGGQQRLDITMNVGQVSQKVEVTGEAPGIQLASSTISGVVNQTDVVQLPLNGRDWTQLATLQPGVDSVNSIQANTGSKDRARRGYGAQLSISGSRPQQNNYRIDGVSVNDYSNGGPGSVEGSTLGVDAVQEFSVLTSNYSAEYGRTSGGVINAISRQGTNQFHGDAYEFLRNSALDARNFFDGPQKPPFRRNQFGGSFGGPIRKNDTFFFGDYEGLRQSQGITTPVNVLSQAARNGQLCSIPQPGPNGCTTQTLAQFAAANNFTVPNPDPTTGINTAVLPYLGLWQLPNAGLTGNGDTGVFNFDSVHVTSENFGTVRVDHRFSDKDSVFGTYQYDRAIATQPDPADEVLTGNTTGRSYVAIEETHIFSPQLVNSVRFGFSRNTHTSQGVKAINPLSAKTSLGASTGADNPQVDVSGLTSIQPGQNQIELVNFFQNSFQEYDDLFLTKGIHSLKFGFAAERIQLNAFNPAPALEYQFGSVGSFLGNQPILMFGPLPSAPFVPFAFRATIFGGYVQDDLRLRPNFTLNLGLRYEMSTVPHEIHGTGRLSALHSLTAPVAISGNPLFHNPTFHNFEPRLGFAWDPFRNGKTSVRGGFGMFDVLPLPYLLGQFTPNAAPFTEGGSVNSLVAGDFPIGAFNKLSSVILAGNGLRLPFVEQNPKRNYVMQWNLSIQHELLPNFTAMVAYVGSRGVHQAFRADDINTTQATLTSAGYLFPGRDPITGALLGTQINPNVGQMDTLQWGNHTFFDGLETQLSKRMSHGFEVQGSFTWSKAIDSGAGTIASDPFVNSIPSLLYFLPKYRRAVSDFNVSRNLTVNYMWNVPSPKSFHGPAAWVSRGWQIGGIFEVRSGLPFTPLIGGDPLGLGNTSPFAYPARLTGAGCGSLVNPGNPTNYIKLQCFAPPMSTAAISAQCIPFSSLAGSCSNLLGSGGRNEIYGPGLVNFDFSLFKDNKIRENLNLQFRAEFFNVFNRANFNSPIANSMLFDSTGAPVGNAGAFDSTSTSSREIQFALKLIF
jgi:hypothetical protein